MSLKNRQRNHFRAILAEAPQPAEFIQFSGGGAIIQAAAGEGENATPGSVFIRAYNGGALQVAGYDAPVYVDLDGCQGIDGKAKIPILRDHDRTRPVGTVTAERDGYAINASGKLTGNSQDRQEIEAMAADGFEWQSSIGAYPSVAPIKVTRGATAKVNGQQVTGPCYIARSSKLREITLLTIGADSETSVAIAAELDSGDPSDDDTTPPPIAAASGSTLQGFKLEQARRDAIEAAALEHAKKGGDVAAIETSMNDAIASGINAQQFELELLKRHTFASGRIQGGTGDQVNEADRAQAVEASALLSLGWSASDLEGEFSERILATMDKDVLLKRGLSLQDMYLYAAEQHGQRVNRRDINAVFRAAFQPIQAASSTFDLSGVLSNIANKSIKRYFMSVTDLKAVSGNGRGQAYSILGSVASVSDFKERTSYALTGDATYEEVGKDGKLKNTTFGEQSYTNQADTYGKIAGISRKDYINDDLGAFGQIGQRLGRGAALKLSDIWWTAFLANSTFFTSARNNYFDGASTNLSISSLTTAEKLFIEQTDPDGKPLNVMASLLLVPPGESAEASTLMSSSQIAYGGTSKNPINNPHVNKYGAWTSPYLSNASYTGNSALAWYLLADPMDMPVIETVFLNGQQMPTIETSQASFDTLGVEMRGFHDFGVNKQEYRGGVKSKGEA